MRDNLLSEISRLTEEEKWILTGKPLDKKVYTAESDFIINDKRLMKGARDVAMRAHPRFVPFPAHKHTFAEIMIVFSGRITHRLGGGEITLSKGDILIMNKHVTHSIDVTEREDLGMNIIISDKFADLLSPRLDGTLFSSFFLENSKRDGKESYMCFRTSGTAEIENLTENLVTEFLTPAPDEFIISETLALLFYHLSKKRGSLMESESGATDKDSFRKLEITSYIKNNYSSASLSELAKRLYISPPYLSKLITEYFGKSFKDLLLEERILRATSLFEKTGTPIGKIIRNMGYENESYFHREYKKRVGKTPLAVRKAAKKSNFS